MPGINGVINGILDTDSDVLDKRTLRWCDNALLIALLIKRKGYFLRMKNFLSSLRRNLHLDGVEQILIILRAEL